MTRAEGNLDEAAAERKGQRRQLRNLRTPAPQGRVLIRTAVTVSSFSLPIAIWYMTIWVFGVADHILPYPHDVLTVAVEERELLLQESLPTVREIGAGFALAAMVGILLGTLIAFSNVADRMLSPLLVTSQAIPKVALAPIFLSWFGFGFRSNVAIAFLIAVFPMVINTALGLKSVEPEMVRLGEAMGGTRGRIFFTIRLPSALPLILAGLKLGVIFASVGAIVGEFVAGTTGLGHLVQSSSGNFNVELGFAAIAVISLLGMGCYALMEGIERFLLRNHPQQQRQILTQ